MRSRLPTPWQGTLAVFVGLLLLISLGMLAQSWSLYGGLLLTEFGLLLGPTIFLASRWKLDLLASFRVGRGALAGMPGTVATGAGIGVMAFVMALGLTLPFLFLVLLSGGEYPGLPLSLTTLPEYLLAMLVGAVVAPLCEEAVFRGFLLSALRPHGVHLAVWVSAACFGIFHLDPIRFVPTLALGVVYGYLTLSTDSVRPSMVAHGVNNGLALTLAFLGGSGGAAATDLNYQALKEEILRNMSAAHLSPGGLSENLLVMVALGVAAVFLFGLGLVMASLIGLILWWLRKDQASSSWEQEERQPVVSLLRLPWLWGISLIGLIFWSLTLWTIYTGKPPPPAEKTGTETAWYLEGGGHKFLIDQGRSGPGKILLTKDIRCGAPKRSDFSVDSCFDSAPPPG